MLKSLKFVQGSVAKKDFLPALTHFVIEHGTVRGFNGTMALCSPIPFDIACKPKADTLIKAIANCDETVQLSLTPAGRLSVKAGKFKAFVDCVQEDSVHPMPEGNIVNFDGQALLTGLKQVAPFIGDDASRRWASGVLVKDQSLFSTNNVMLAQYWLGVDFPNVVTIPLPAVKEMLRINEAPLFAQFAQNSITFHYSEERWLRTQLYDSEAWPSFDKILNKPSAQTPIDEELFTGLDVIKPFVDKFGTVIFQQQRIATHDDENEGASFDLPNLIGEEGRYNIQMLELLKGIAKTIDWSGYPGPCLFQNDRLRGAIIGMRQK
jgi:DNA polymerase III sliding clamp (beta) subunit (PCNA family)